MPIRSFEVPFGEWMPDQPARGAGAAVVKNAYAKEQSYRSVGALEAFTDALDGAALGSVWIKYSGSYYNFAGDSTKLYQLSAGSYSNVSIAGNYSGIQSWEFIRWGDRMIAISLENVPQYFDMGTSSLFANLAGSPPKAKHGGVIRDFIVLGNLNESSTAYPNRLRWSGFNNSEIWTPSLSTQSDFQDLQYGGAVQKIVPGEEGYIYQEDAITRMTYVGPPVVFQFDIVERERGAYAANSVCWWGSTHYFYAQDGFYAFNGVQSTPIGQGKVDLYIRNDLDTNDLENMVGAVDRKNRLVVWQYPSLSKGANQLITYHIPTGKWTLIDQSTEWLAEHSSSGYDLDTIDAVLTNGIDTDSFNMDANAYTGGEISLGAFNTSHQLGTFTGADMTATIDTGEFDAPNGKRLAIKSLRPMSDGTHSLKVGTRDNQNDLNMFGSAVSENVKGEFSVLTSSRYARVRAEISGGFNDAQGIQIFYREEGRQ